MTWNYRIVKRGEGEDVFYGIYEVYYDKFNGPQYITENPIFALGDTVKELAKDMAYMLKAFEKPILTFEDFEGDTYGKNT